MAILYLDQIGRHSYFPLNRKQILSQIQPKYIPSVIDFRGLEVPKEARKWGLIVCDNIRIFELQISLE